MSDIKRPDCPKCNQSNPKRSGHASGGKQRWHCMACHFEFTRVDGLGKPREVKLYAALMYEEGHSSTKVAQLLGVSPTSVLRWSRDITWPTGRAHSLKPRFVTPEPYRSMFRETRKLGALVKEQASYAGLRGSV